MGETLEEIKSKLNIINNLVGRIIDNEAKSKVLLSLEAIDLELIKELIIDYSCNTKESLSEVTLSHIVVLYPIIKLLEEESLIYYN